MACGGAAGIAAAYNAPISGALFVSEIVLGVLLGHLAPPFLGLIDFTKGRFVRLGLPLQWRPTAADTYISGCRRHGRQRP